VTPGTQLFIDGVGIVTLLRFDPRRPMCKQGKRLGSWSNNFYRPMWLVQMGKSTKWIKAGRVAQGRQP